MNGSLLLMGLCKAAFGILIGAVGIFVASRALHRLIGSGGTDSHTRKGNLAIGVLKAGSLIALGLLMRHPVSATFDAMDLLYRDRTLTLTAVRQVATYATLHVGLSIVVSAVVLAFGTWLFTKLTRGIDEMAEVRQGNAAPALVLAAVMVVLALMTAPGLETALEGLLPLPTLGRDEIRGPHVKATLRAVLLGLWLPALWLPACCFELPSFELSDLFPRKSKRDDKGPVPGGGGEAEIEPGRVDLGIGRHPDGQQGDAAFHPFLVKNIDPDRYRLGYALAKQANGGLYAAFHAWAGSVGHERVAKDRFRWRPPEGCQSAGLRCAYEALEAQGRASVAPLAALFKSYAAKAKLDSFQLTSLVVAFVQEIDYRTPDEEPFGLLPPALVVWQRWGDCDSKSLLAHMILRQLGVDSMLISSDAHKHTMLGVGLPAPGSHFTFRGHRYAFVEMTAKRSPIGHINPELLRPSDWRAVPLRYLDAAPAPSSGLGLRFDDGEIRIR